MTCRCRCHFLFLWNCWGSRLALFIYHIFLFVPVPSEFCCLPLDVCYSEIKLGENWDLLLIKSLRFNLGLTSIRFGPLVRAQPTDQIRNGLVLYCLIDNSLTH